jgi:hypothetical protein
MTNFFRPQGAFGWFSYTTPWDTICRADGLRSSRIARLPVLIKDAGRKVFLILDNLGVHHCKPVKAWLKNQMDRMEVFTCPAIARSSTPKSA